MAEEKKTEPQTRAEQARYILELLGYKPEEMPLFEKTADKFLDMLYSLGYTFQEIVENIKVQDTAPAEEITPTPERQRPKRVFFKPEGEPIPTGVPNVELVRYWAKYPFRVGLFSQVFASPLLPDWETMKPPTPAMLKFVKEALKVSLNVLQVRKKVHEFLPNADIENWSFQNLMIFCIALGQDIEIGGVNKDASTPAAVAAPVKLKRGDRKFLKSLHVLNLLKENPYLTVAQLAAQVGCSRQYIYKLPAYNIYKEKQLGESINHFPRGKKINGTLEAWDPAYKRGK